MKVTTLFFATAGSVIAFTPLSTPATRAKSQLSVSNKDDGDMSKALPFVPRPKLLDGSLAGDVGFE